ncbi:hypothetical protein VNO77_02721 [Canavalia gladiata]|uniref:Uncharacterized protein n=1 Tax=Canavalia gladiata TaxID=3824 RepID=A0AAN9MYQ7_CANGL
MLASCVESEKVDMVRTIAIGFHVGEAQVTLSEAILAIIESSLSRNMLILFLFSPTHTAIIKCTSGLGFEETLSALLRCAKDSSYGHTWPSTIGFMSKLGEVSSIQVQYPTLAFEAHDDWNFRMMIQPALAIVRPTERPNVY